MYLQYMYLLRDNHVTGRVVRCGNFQKPYTWFKLGQAVLEGGCYALALALLAKAAVLLPPGLQQQEKVGGVSSAGSSETTVDTNYSK